MAKGSAGGKLSRGLGSNSNATNNVNLMWQRAFQPPPQNNQPDSNAPTQDAKKLGLDGFAKLSDDEKAAYVNGAHNERVDKGFPNTYFQKFAKHVGLDDKPNMVDDAVLDKMSGRDYFRGVKADNDQSGDAIVLQTMTEDRTWYSDTGGSMVGRGIYAGDTDTAVRYACGGLFSNGNGHGRVMRFKLDKSAKTITWRDAKSLLNETIRQGGAYGRALSRLQEKDAVSVVAAGKGYTMVDGGWANALLCRKNIYMSWEYATNVTRNKENWTWKQLLK